MSFPYCPGFFHGLRLGGYCPLRRVGQGTTVPILRTFVVALAQVAGDVGRPWLMAGLAAAHMLSGGFDPSGKISISWSS